MPTTASISTQHLTSQASLAEREWSVRRLLFTTAGWSGTMARVVLAIVMFPHGAQKLLGWFGGYGFSGTLGFLTGKMGLPAPLAASVILIEFAAPVLLVAGLGTRFAALGIGAVMIGAIATVHASQGFFMNWSGSQAGEGFEYHLLALGLVAVLFVQGGGFMSLDRLLTSRSARAHRA
jgi:putative oxidoreductase